MNALAKLAEHLGLSHEQIAARVGSRTSQVAKALSAEPDEPLATYFKICQALGVRLRVKVENPLRLWFAADAIDALCRDGAWRKAVGLEPMPQTRADLRKYVKRLRRRRRLSYGEIVDLLERNFVPTVVGHRNWRRSTIGQMLKASKDAADAKQPLGITDQFRTQFRKYAINHLLVAMCPFDPFAPVRYGLSANECADGRVYVTSGAPLPDPVRRCPPPPKRARRA